jgi:aminomethyltransferase
MLAWTISKRRRAQGGFLGSETVMRHMEDGVTMKRCGFISGKVPIRQGVKLYLPESDTEVGFVTSGSPSPSLKRSVGMAYVNTPFNKFKT